MPRWAWNKGMGLETVTCLGCGKLITRHSWLNRHHSNYCNQACFKKDPVLKRCKECGNTFPVAHFEKQGISKLTGRQYYRPRCKTCDASYKKVAQQARIALKKGSMENGFTAQQWQAIQERFNGKCAYCGATLEESCQDHFVPLSRNGQHIVTNVLPSCRRCNSSKNSSLPWEWLSPAKYAKLRATLNSLG